ncbi:NAD-dependent epimerase [Rhodohalobacter sp. SW132]|uniref:NAD-dependent epimerase n=1 Tax=Rhodohalobacter sp. SW132 TaxID=2293433 RepID=UPI000E266143|nr:NAD-dependent epimerase [Rhodohalobacter sp. SW132]REL24746.1 NAD-dependent epimerase [Rhodohalobacter sp. SW132]
MKKVLVTGAAGFIGYHLCRRLISEGYDVYGLDNLNDYYSTDLKWGRLEQLGTGSEFFEEINNGKLVKSENHENCSFVKADLSSRESVEDLFRAQSFDVVINLAAQAGVRYSLENPHAYTSSNVEGFLNILEGCRHTSVKHLIYASSSSVYGANAEIPFHTADRADSPVSLYAATKKANEMMAYTYSHLYGIATTGLRFFTVYGPWGRPDMAYFKFANLMRNGKQIDVYNNGNMSRDFTYIDDIVESIKRLIPRPPKNSDNGDEAPANLFNIGNGSPVNLLEFIEILEKELGMKAEKNMMPMQPGDVEKTWADVDDLFEYIDYRPEVGIEEGIQSFVKWYKEYYGI